MQFCVKFLFWRFSILSRTTHFKILIHIVMKKHLVMIWTFYVHLEAVTLAASTLVCFFHLEMTVTEINDDFVPCCPNYTAALLDLFNYCSIVQKNLIFFVVRRQEKGQIIICLAMSILRTMAQSVHVTHSPILLRNSTFSPEYNLQE